jgi:hypothetical protein
VTPEAERPTESAAASSAAKLPPFKRDAPASTTLPLLSKVTEAPATLLFNDVDEDAPMCDPNDPDCELV